jgi:hypothetical protein
MELKQDPIAWREGYTAGLRLDDNQTCPYPAASAKAWAWRSGFLEGRAYRGPYTEAQVRLIDAAGGFLPQLTTTRSCRSPKLTPKSR